MFPLALGLGGLFVLLGAGLFYYGMRMAQGEMVDWGLGTHYDRTAFKIRGVLVIVIGVMMLLVGIFANIS
ncbi:MAG TPA: hypothetical protein VEH86_01005 [Candidatus Acidoferrum sp.]|nr:hypothetical protein [Candidatus Acidoferrum sp.]